MDKSYCKSVISPKIDYRQSLDNLRVLLNVDEEINEEFKAEFIKIFESLKFKSNEIDEISFNKIVNQLKSNGNNDQYRLVSINNLNEDFNVIYDKKLKLFKIPREKYFQILTKCTHEINLSQNDIKKICVALFPYISATIIHHFWQNCCPNRDKNRNLSNAYKSSKAGSH
jgi:hypothetical protein